MLKPQDVLLMCKLTLLDKQDWAHIALSEQTGLSVGETYRAMNRCRQAGFVIDYKEGSKIIVQKLFDFLVYGAPGCFFAVKTSVTRGYPTAIYAPGLREKFPRNGESEISMVWPVPRGEIEGEGLEPIYSSVPEASKKDARLYDLMALVDVLRVGRAKERDIASRLLAKQLNLTSSPP